MARTPRKPTSARELKRWLKRYSSAKENRDRAASIVDDCYEFCLPLRQRTYMTAPYEKRTDRLFDSTAPEAIQDFASLMFDEVWPADAKPFELQAGRGVDKGARAQANRDLAEVADHVIETINNSNFRSAAHEAMLDFAIGTGVLLIEEGDAVNPIRFSCLPLAEVVLDIGPYGTIDALFWPRKVRAGDLLTVYPEAQLPANLASMVEARPDEMVEVLEGVERDWTEKSDETHSYRCVATNFENAILKEGSYVGFGSCPFVSFSYTRVTGETMGRGPAQIALPDIKTLNLVKQLILENADIAISGVWQAADDGVLNADTVTIAPGTIIAKAPGSAGLEPLEAAGDFNVGDLVAKELQIAIRRIFLGDDLGPPTGTPPSATEVIQRTVNRAKRLSGPYGRLLTEFLTRVVLRVAHILRRRGEIELAPVDGRKVVLKPLSPLTRAQAQDEVLRHDRWLEMMNARVGPQVTQLVLKSEEYALFTATKMGVNPNLVRTEPERKQLAAAIAQFAAQAAQQQQGGAPLKVAA